MKKGSKIICIDNSNQEIWLELYKTYEIAYILYNEYGKNKDAIAIDNLGTFYKERFKTLKEIRKQKLDKLNNL